MGLEEIESRIGSLIQEDTIPQLKSAAWKERLEGRECIFCFYVTSAKVDLTIFFLHIY